MSQLDCRELSFCYPNQESAILEKVSFSLEEGQIAVLCGKSGCGKSTLLRLIKQCHKPFGIQKGEIYFEGQRLEEMSKKCAAGRIGFVGQNPDAQIVTDKVWHELAFGLESLGIDHTQMHRRVAEMAEYFGISDWFDKSTNQLSGGQKQILNLASVMVMQPRLLLLDEPTSQLDPIGAERFLHTLCRLNQDFGVTVFLSEQCLEEVLPIVDRVFLLQDKELIEAKEVRKTGQLFYEQKSEVFHALPAATRLYVECGKTGREPIHVAQAVSWLQEKNVVKQLRMVLERKEDIGKKSEVALSTKENTEKSPEIVLLAKQISYAYDKKEKPILKDFSIGLRENCISAILGGNGSGKTTALKVLAGIYSPQKGKRKAKGRVVYLPQNPQLMFTEPTVCEELEAVFVEQSKQFAKLSEKDIAERIEQMLIFMELMPMQAQHPFDLSGGQQQRLAIAKLLLLEPDILLLDEPTKGLDAAFKRKLGELLKELTQKNKTVVLVSHDMEFCAEYAQYCGLLFQGAMTELETVKEFFGKNYFYAPMVPRIWKRIQEDAGVIKYQQALELLEKAFLV